MDKKTSIFREKSIDRISSPEQLDDYVKATTPGVWVLLAAIMVFLAGFIAFCIFGTVETDVKVVVYSDGTNMACYFDEVYLDQMNEDMQIDMDMIDGDYHITAIYDKPVGLNPDKDNDAAIIHMLGIEAEDGNVVWASKAKVEGAKLPKDTYIGKVVIDNIAPYTFVTN